MERSTGISILICDDNRDFAQSIADKFLEQGFSVHVAYHGLAGAELLGQHPDISLCILDLVMPPGTEGGLYLLKRIRAYGARLPVVIFTGEATVDRAVAVTRSGADRVLEKCSGLDKLLSVSLELLAEYPVPENKILPLQQLMKDVDLCWRVNRASLDVERKLRQKIAVLLPAEVLSRCPSGMSDELRKKLEGCQTLEGRNDRLSIGDLFILAILLSKERLVSLAPAKQLDGWAKLIVPVRNQLSHYHADIPPPQNLVRALLACHDLLEAL